MNNKHDINPYDRLFLKTLDYGDMMPMAVIKNYDRETQAVFERRVNTLLDRLSNGDVNFGTVCFGDDEFYIVACRDTFTRLNLISQGQSLGQALDDKGKSIDCYMFDTEKDLMDAGIAPIMRFEIKSNADASRTKSLIQKMSSSAVKMPDFELSLISNGDEKTVFARQTGMGEILSFYGKARVLALETLSNYRNIIKNVRRLDIDGKAYKSRLGKDNFDAAHNNRDCVTMTFEKETFKARLDREITAEDLDEFQNIDFGEGRVVVSVLKNPWVSLKNLHRICHENKSVSALDCELVSFFGQDGDRFILFVVDKENAAPFAVSASIIEAKLLNGSSKSFAIKMMNIDNRAKVVPVDMRLVGRLFGKNKSKLRDLEERFDTEESFDKLEPEIVKYDDTCYGVYIRNYTRSQCKHTFEEVSVDVVRDAIMASGIKYELTDAYGEILPKENSKSKSTRKSRQSEDIIAPSKEMEK